MPIKTKRRRSAPKPPPRPAEVLDVQGAAALLTVSADTVYDLLQRANCRAARSGANGSLPPPCCVGLRKHPATTAWRAERGDMGALTRAMNKGKVRVSPKGE
jgi:hypothetical protein